MFTTQSACFDIADRLVNYTEGVVTTTPVYDYRGRVTGMGGDSFVYDQADRHVSTTGSGVTVSYTRDASGAIVARSEGGATVRYSGSAVLSAANVVLERSVSLPGGVMVTKLVAGDVWSYPNVHGDIVAVCDVAGVKQGPTYVYDPYGNTASLPDNSYGAFDFGWVGQHSKHTEHTTGLGTVIEMGARIYHPSLGRFLSVDPVEGGCSNDYVYVTDPVNDWDLTGTESRAEKCRKATRAFEAKKKAYLKRKAEHEADVRNLKGTRPTGRDSYQGHIRAMKQAVEAMESAYRLMVKWCHGGGGGGGGFSPPPPAIDPSLFLIAGVAAIIGFAGGSGGLLTRR